MNTPGKLSLCLSIGGLFVLPIMAIIGKLLNANLSGVGLIAFLGLQIAAFVIAFRNRSTDTLAKTVMYISPALTILITLFTA